MADNPGSPPPKPSASLLLINPIAYMEQMQMYNMAIAMYQQEMNQYAAEMKAWEGEMGEYGEGMKEWEEEMTQFKADMEAYEDEMLQYQDDMEIWQDEYQEWKENRAKAVGEAEATIGIVREKYGDALDVNVASHWGWLIFIMVVNAGFIFGAMKWRDRKR